MMARGFMDTDVLLKSLPYYVCTVAALGTTMVTALSVLRRMYPRRILFLGAGCLFLGMSFFLIAATASPTGHVNRSVVALPIELLALVGGLLWVTWLALAVKAAVKVEKKRPTG